MSAADGAQGAKPAGQPYPNLIKPTQVDGLPFMQDPSAKQKMFSAVSQYWSILNSSPADSQQHKAAFDQLTKISNSVRTRLAQWREQNPQAVSAQRPRSQGQPQTQQAQQQAVQGGEQATPTQNAAPAGQPQPQIAPPLMKHISEFQFSNPRDKPRGTPEGEKWLKAAKDHYTNLLVRMEKTKSAITHLDKLIEQNRQRNANIPQEIMDKKAGLQKDWETAKAEVGNFRKAQSALQQQNAQQAQHGLQQVKTETGATQTSGVAQNVNMQAPGQQNGQQTAQRPPANAAANPGLTNTQNQNRTSISSATGGQVPQTQGFAQPQGPNQQNQAMQQAAQNAVPTRPPLNTQIPPQAGQTPQSAVNNQPMNQNGPRTLSQKEAIAQAQRSYSERQTPQSATGQYAPVGSREPPPSGSKFPIPKSLPDRATSIPAPVSMSAPRPTLSGPANGLGGMMGQVPIEKQPGTIMLEGGEGGVLSRKKLHELVREVGGPDESLTPEVEDVS